MRVHLNLKYSLFIGEAIYAFRFKIPTTLGALRGPIGIMYSTLRASSSTRFASAKKLQSTIQSWKNACILIRLVPKCFPTWGPCVQLPSHAWKPNHRWSLLHNGKRLWRQWGFQICQELNLGRWRCGSLSFLYTFPWPKPFAKFLRQVICHKTSQCEGGLAL